MEAIRCKRCGEWINLSYPQGTDGVCEKCCREMAARRVIGESRNLAAILGLKVRYIDKMWFVYGRGGPRPFDDACSMRDWLKYIADVKHERGENPCQPKRDPLTV